MFPPLLHSTVTLVLSFAGGFIFRQQILTNTPGTHHSEPNRGTLSASAINSKKALDPPPWPPNATVDQVLEAIEIEKGGDPALAVGAVLEGILMRPDMTVKVANTILYYALSEDPGGVTDYLLQALEGGKLDILRTKFPLPPDLHHPALPKLLAGYTKAFSAGWEASPKPLPFDLRRLRYLPPAAFQNCLSAMGEAGPDSLRLAATLYPREIAARPGLAVSTLKLLTKPQARLAMFHAALTSSETPPTSLTSSCQSPTERLLVNLLGAGFSEGTSSAEADVTEVDVEALLQVLRPDEALYAGAGSLNDPATRTRIKTEIIRKLTETNLVAATRALANDPAAPDKATALAVAAMDGDPAATQAWTERIKDPVIKARFPTLHGLPTTAR